jgi:hypothetical protein
MLTNIFENRNRGLTNLLKMGDYLGRSLRENVELFSIDNNEVTYLTESGAVIKGSVAKDGRSLTNIKVEDSSLFEDKDNFSKLVDSRVSNFVSNIIENDLQEAGDSFEDVLKLWETRINFNLVKDKLERKIARFDESTNIVQTPEFERVVELKEEITEFLANNKDVIDVPELRNAIKLTSIVAESFNVPRLDYETLVEEGYNIPKKINDTLYEHLTKTELIRKELLEAKNGFDNIWATNEKLSNLASMIYEKDQNKFLESVANLTLDVPYFALATKKQINNSLRSVYNLVKQNINEMELKNYVHKIYETKKPIKNYVLDLLNNKYGVDIRQLNETPTLNTLAAYEKTIFETISEVMPKNSNARRVLQEFANSLESKNGVETIDVSDFLCEVFEEAGYADSLNETQLMNYLDFTKVADDLGKIGNVLKMLQATVQQTGMAAGQPAPHAEPDGDEGMMGGDMDGDEMGAEQGGIPDMSEDPYDSNGESAIPEGEPNDDITQPEMDAEQAADETMQEAPAEEGMEGAPEGEEEEEEGGFDLAPEDEKEALVDNLKELEDLLSTLKSDMGVEDGGDMGEEESEEEVPAEDEEMPEGEESEGEEDNEEEDMDDDDDLEELEQEIGGEEDEDEED